MPQMPYEPQNDVSGGINTYVHTSLIPETMATNLLNCDITEPGVVKKRKGITIAGSSFGSKKVMALSGYRLLSGSDKLIAIDETYLWHWNGGSGAWESVAHGKTLTEAEIIICNDDAVILNDGANQMSWDQSSLTDYDGANNMIEGALTGLWHKNRLLLAKNDQLYWSTTLDFSDGNWNSTVNTHKIDKGSGQVIKKIHESQKDVLIVFLDNSIFALNTSPSVSYWDATKIAGRGCIAKRSVCQYGNQVFYLSRDGFWMLGGQYPLTKTLENGWIDRINWVYAHKACATVVNNTIRLAVPVDGSTFNNCVFVYNLLGDMGRDGKGWAVWMSDKLRISDWAHFDFNNEQKLYGGYAGPNGVVYEVDSDTKFSDDGDGYAFEYETRGYSLGNPIVDKSWDTLEVTAEAKAEESILLTVEASSEENDYIQVMDENGVVLNVARELTDLSNFNYSAFNFGNDFLKSGYHNLKRFNRGKYLQLRVKNSQIDVPVEIHRLVVSAIPQLYRRTAH